MSEGSLNIDANFTDILGNFDRQLKNINRLQKIDLSLIEVDLEQPRTIFEEESIKDLAESIKAYGLMQPITIYKIADKKYKILAGHRRYRAVKLLGFNDVDAIVQEQVEDNTLIVRQLTENLQREDLTHAEIANSLQKMLNLGIKQSELSDLLKKSRSFVSEHLAFSQLPSEIIQSDKINNLKNAIALGQIYKEKPIETEEFIKKLDKQISKNDVENFKASLEITQNIEKVEKNNAKKVKKNDISNKVEITQTFEVAYKNNKARVIMNKVATSGCVYIQLGKGVSEVAINDLKFIKLVEV